MKKVIAVLFVSLLSTQSFATVKCVPDGRGGMCCWNINTEGPFKPIGCLGVTHEEHTYAINWHQKH